MRRTAGRSTPVPPCRSVDAHPRTPAPAPGPSPDWPWAGPRCPSWCPTTRSTRCCSSTPASRRADLRAVRRSGRSPGSSPRCPRARSPTGGPAAASSSWPACCRPPAFVVWTAAPALWAFAVGFVIWGVGGALVSGASEALVYDGLAAVGAADSYARVNGWMTAAELLVQIPTAFAAARCSPLGGYALGGLGERRGLPGRGALALRFPEAPRADGRTAIAGWAPCATGVAEALHRPALRLARARRRADRRSGRGRGVLPRPRRRLGRADVGRVPVAVLVIALAGCRRGRAGRPGRPAARRRAAGAARRRGGLSSRPPRCGPDRPRWSPSRCSTRSTSACWSSPRRGCRTGSRARTGRRSPRSPAWASSWRRCWCSPPGRWAARLAVAVLVLAVVPVVRAGLRTREPV